MTESHRNIPGTTPSGASIPDPSESADAQLAALTPEAVRALADFADLPLAPGREQAVAAVLGAWLPDIDALSRKMSAPAYRDLVPVTTFIHPGVDDGEV